MDAIDEGYEPTEQERREVLDWFERYDALAYAGDVEAMADLALFPLNEVTDDAAGHAVVGLCDRERYLAQMRAVIVPGAAMASRRRPVFLGRALVFVVSDAAITVDGHDTTMRYGDLLVRTAEGWRFQTMVAGGWHEAM